MEEYGGENLPVLIQLPDLSAEDQGLRPVTQPLGLAAEESAATDDSDICLVAAQLALGERADEPLRSA